MGGKGERKLTQEVTATFDNLVDFVIIAKDQNQRSIYHELVFQSFSKKDLFNFKTQFKKIPRSVLKKFDL